MHRLYHLHVTLYGVYASPPLKGLAQVLFTGGAMRVVGLFPLSGPLLAAEREAAAQKPLLQRMGSFCPSLDMVRRPESSQPWELPEQLVARCSELLS